MQMRRKLGVGAFAASLAGLVRQNIHPFLMTNFTQNAGTGDVAGAGVVVVIACAMLAWSMSANKKGYLS